MRSDTTLDLRQQCIDENIEIPNAFQGLVNPKKPKGGQTQKCVKCNQMRQDAISLQCC